MNPKHFDFFIGPSMASLRVDGREILVIQFVLDSRATGSTPADFFRLVAAYCEAQKITNAYTR